MGPYIAHLLVLIGVYLLLVYSLNLTSGYGGLLVFCHAAFYGIGAYSYALLRLGLNGRSEDLKFVGMMGFVPATIIAGLAAALSALAIGTVSLRFRGDFFIFATLAFQMIVFVVLYNAMPLTRGPFGIYGIPRPDLLGWRARDPVTYLGVIGVIDLLLLFALFVLYRSPFGLTLKALRENERAAESLGISPARHYLVALVIGGFCAGIAGAMFASYVTYIDPTSFHLRESIFIVSVLLLGGSGNRLGPLVGVTMMILFPEVLRWMGFAETIAPNIREVIYGLALIVLMTYRPKGIAGSYAWQ